MARRIVMVLLLLIMFFTSTACTSDQGSIVGTWIITEYEVNGDTVSPENLADIMGEVSSENNKYSLIFTATGNVTLIRPDYNGGTTEAKLAYTVQEEWIEVYDPDDSSDYQLLSYQDDVISFELGSGFIAFLKEK